MFHAEFPRFLCFSVITFLHFRHREILDKPLFVVYNYKV